MYAMRLFNLPAKIMNSSVDSFSSHFHIEQPAREINNTFRTFSYFSVENWGLKYLQLDFQCIFKAQ